MISKYYRYFRWLSLDIVLGAIVYLAYLGRLYQLSIDWNVFFALAAAIWLIYTADHLVDAQGNGESARRSFHREYSELLVFISGCVLALSLINIYFLPAVIIRNGAILASVCVGYLVLVYFVRGLWYKEVMVAFIYSVGIFLAPVSLRGVISPHDLILIAQLFVAAFTNLLVFSRYDMARDEEEGFGSMPLRWGLGRTNTLLNTLLIAGFVLNLFALFVIGMSFSSQLLFGLMMLVLACLVWLPGIFIHNERYRILGDGVFLVPLLFLL